MVTHRTLTATLLVQIQSRLPETCKVLRSLNELVRNTSGSEVLKNGKSSCSKWSEMNSLTIDFSHEPFRRNTVGVLLNEGIEKLSFLWRSTQAGRRGRTANALGPKGCEGSNPSSSAIILYRSIAQLVERRPPKPKVKSSSLFAPAIGITILITSFQQHKIR